MGERTPAAIQRARQRERSTARALNRWKGAAIECTCTHGIHAHRQLTGCMFCPPCRAFELGRFLTAQRNGQTTMKPQLASDSPEPSDSSGSPTSQSSE